MDDNIQWIRTREAAQIIGVSISQIRNMIHAGLFEYTTHVSNKPYSHYLLRLDEVEKAKHIYRTLRYEKPRCGRKATYEYSETAK